jgi:hypothetical protein
MEDILDLYEEPYDAKRPVICFDEKPYQLLDHSLEPIKAFPGQIRREDYEYVRQGTCNIFVWVDPKSGRRQAKVTDRRTKRDFAEYIREMVDEHFVGVEKIRLVMDNLNIHRLSHLYEFFPPEEARRLIKRIEVHYTPKHGSWLNMAEIEISALTQQSLRRRLGSVEHLSRELGAIVNERNRLERKITWGFSTEQARVKLARIYY